MRVPTSFVLLLCVVLVAAFFTAPASANRVGTCLRNCAQCTKMFGRYFDGPLCADTCVKFKAKYIPDCEDAESIAPFVIKPANNGMDDYEMDNALDNVRKY